MAPEPIALRVFEDASQCTGYERYVSEKVWEKATLPRCPLHPRGGCGFARHGTSAQKTPEGARVARFYCRKGRVTLSLLPDCLASRLRGTLVELESVVAAAESGKSVESASETLRSEIELPGAVRWLRRRVNHVRQALTLARGLFPESLAGTTPTLFAFRQVQGREPGVLSRLRAVLDGLLRHLPSPLGFSPRWGSTLRVRDGPQQSMGPVCLRKKT